MSLFVWHPEAVRDHEAVRNHEAVRDHEAVRHLTAVRHFTIAGVHGNLLSGRLIRVWPACAGTIDKMRESRAQTEKARPGVFWIHQG